MPNIWHTDLCWTQYKLLVYKTTFLQCFQQQVSCLWSFKTFYVFNQHIPEICQLRYYRYNMTEGTAPVIWYILFETYSEKKYILIRMIYIYIFTIMVRNNIKQNIHIMLQIGLQTPYDIIVTKTYFNFYYLVNGWQGGLMRIMSGDIPLISSADRDWTFFWINFVVGKLYL